MAIVRWDPFREFTQLQDRISRVFSDAYGHSGSGADESLMTSGTWLPPVDVFQNDDKELVLKAELPDMSREDIEITVDNSTLTIKGEKKLSSEVKEEHFHRMERALRHVQPVVLAATDGRPDQGGRRIQERRVDAPAASARGMPSPARSRSRSLRKITRPCRSGRLPARSTSQAVLHVRTCPTSRQVVTLKALSWTSRESTCPNSRRLPTAPAEPAPPIQSRFLFVDVAALRAKQLRAAAPDSSRRG